MRSLPLMVLLIAIALGTFFGLRAAGVGEHSRTTVAAAAFVPEAEYAERSPHVNSLLNVTGIQGSVRGQSAFPPPDHTPIPASRFRRPVAEYLAYSVNQLTIMQREMPGLRAALAAGNRSAAEASWREVWSRYLRLGGAYLEGQIAALNQKIDGGPGGLPGGTSSPQFIGLHRIEFGLWTGAPLGSLIPYVDGLETNVAAMKAALPHTAIDPLDFATRTHEILEDAQRDLLSGTDVPWSGEGVLGTAAGIAATQELINTLRPLLVEPPAQADPPANPRSPAVAEADLKVLNSVLDSLAREHGGELPTNQQLTSTQAERLDAALGQALEGLAQIPGMLETVNPPPTPKIPRSGIKIENHGDT
jgi:iron uptake system EfeUOB component EfeO/EfeM